ncbi:DUF3306 domain-containing protein [Limnohabitans sp. 2KL-27]|uniref:DUF3306 domain-containing protein n=1 Tax=Limnohabitans sp. 2KL-27 TaxID=1100705 RepID=UPI000ABF4A79|nr:DUF3306 domain-containing protein [Limnohabitans sp. 2KL-27]
MSDNFFSRWSRRKQGLEPGEAPPPESVPRVAPAKEASPSGLGPDAPPPHPVPGRTVTAEAPLPADAPQPALPTMADVQGLTPASDFQTFMRQGVPGEVRNAAMKKLFTDPHFNVMDGLDIYIGDYNTPDPLPAGMLEKMVGAELLNLFPKKDPADTPQTEASEAQENHAKSPDETQVSPLVAQSPSSTTQALQPIPALQASETTAHDHPDLQLQPNHAPASPSPGASTG